MMYCGRRDRAYTSVCPLAYLKNNKVEFQQIFCTFYLWPCLGSPLMAMQYVMYTSVFVNDVMLSYNDGKLEIALPIQALLTLCAL